MAYEWLKNEYHLSIMSIILMQLTWGAIPKANYGHKFCHYQKSSEELGYLPQRKSLY